VKWIKKGLIFAPDGSKPWMRKYAFPPTPILRSNDVLRVFVAFCDENTVGRVGYVDLDPDNPSRVLGVSKKPVLDIGAPGAFDENGVVPTCVVRVGGQLRLYYVGYQLGYKLRYFQFQGLAMSEDNGDSFTRFSTTPIIDRSDSEMVNRTSAFVMHDEGVFKMWYVAGSTWTQGRDKPLPVYNMRYLESADGLTWGKRGEVCLDFKDEDEHALGRPWIIKEAGRYKMFFSSRTRSRGYRLGYAESSDGRSWTRKDGEVGLDVSASGWDSEMVAYTSLVKRGRNTFLFYNGTNCGQTGFGYAVLDES